MDLNVITTNSLERLAGQDTVSRIWRKDHTVWKPAPTEIADRLGWLDVMADMRSYIKDIQSFAQVVRDSGFRHVVLLGMGGSSLGPEVLTRTFGSANGYPELIVLDTTVPDWLLAVERSIDLKGTLFIVSSKSGTTVETVSGYRYFWSTLERAVGAEKAGQSFAAITDRGTPLARLASEKGFRRTFVNPSDIGGRYSVLSYFGLVPAALMGIDLEALLGSAAAMRRRCLPDVSLSDNPGAWLGAAMGTLALQGRDKLTLVTSPSLSSFGLWTEQLVAESTGKEGKGIVPVAGEPLLAPESYGEDRLFVYLRLEGDDNVGLDAAVDAIEAGGHPVVRLGLADPYDLGGEFFRWEFAVAVAGAVLGINPFDQPNVQQSKDLTARVLGEYRARGRFPVIAATSSIHELLAGVRAGDYLAIMAYLRPTPELERAVSALREGVMKRHRIATTFGYGPRFLHSTGQLHKGGPDSGMFLQMVAPFQEDIEVPEAGYSFGTLAQAQALGDLQALTSMGRRVASVDLGADPAACVRGLASALG